MAALRYSRLLSCSMTALAGVHSPTRSVDLLGAGSSEAEPPRVFIDA